VTIATDERVLTYREALREALALEMERDRDVFLMGEDIGDYGGVFKVTLGLLDRFGEQRVIETPIAEAGFVGAAIGAAMEGKRPIVEIMFADFLLVAADQLLNQAAKMRFLSADQWRVPLTIRTQHGVGSGTAAQHSQCFEAFFMHIPGFSVIAPATPADAKGLLAAAVRDDDPSLFIEHKMLYGTSGHVPEGDYVIPLGQAAVRREGRDVTIVSYSRSVLTVLDAAEALAEQGVDAEVLDLRTIVPLDWDAVLTSVEKTGRLLIVHEAHRTAGVGAEIAAEVADRAFSSLDAPIRRVCGLDMPVPYTAPLEAAWVPSVDDVLKAAVELVRQ
jgi:pyruvate/2-oxoglutarate/acetoin dehydrogenase E1 component